MDMVWLEGLLVSKADSPSTEAGANPLASFNEGSEGGVVEPEPRPAPDKTVDAENSGRTESDTQGTLPPADNSILPEFEFHTNNLLARSTPKKDRLLKTEPTLCGDAESSFLYLPSAVTHIEGWEPVPSSRSPSPMVLRKSPSKEEEREQRAHQVITESITTLLGKRQASKEEVVATAQNGRLAKRSRPLFRAKVGVSPLLFGEEIYNVFTVVE